MNICHKLSIRWPTELAKGKIVLVPPIEHETRFRLSDVHRNNTFVIIRRMLQNINKEFTKKTGNSNEKEAERIYSILINEQQVIFEL